MNITMNRAELLHAVKRAAAVAPANSPLEALKGVLLEVSAASKSLAGWLFGAATPNTTCPYGRGAVTPKWKSPL